MNYFMVYGCEAYILWFMDVRPIFYGLWMSRPPLQDPLTVSLQTFLLPITFLGKCAAETNIFFAALVLKQKPTSQA